MPSAIAFLLEDLTRDLAANDLAGIISDLDPESFSPRVLSLSGDPRSLPAAAQALLPPNVPIKGPLRRPLWNVGLIRRFLLDVKEAKPTLLVFAGGKDVLEFAAKAIGWIERPAVYLAPSGDPTFPWSQRKALDAFTKIVATTGRLTYRLVEELGVSEKNVATIYPGIDTDRFAFSPLPQTGESVLVGIVGEPPTEGARALAAALAGLGDPGAGGKSAKAAGEGPGGAAGKSTREGPGAGRAAGASGPALRAAAPGAREPLVDLGPSWSPEALARVSLLLFLPDSDWESGFETMLRGMAVGRPVIAAVPSERLDEMVIDGETGRVLGGAADAEPAAIAAAARDLLSAPDLLASMGVAARMRIAGEFSRPRRSADWDALLRVIAGIPFPPPRLKGPAAPPPGGPAISPIRFNP